MARGCAGAYRPAGLERRPSRLTAVLLAADHKTSDDTLDATRRSEAAAVRGEAAANVALKEQTAFAEEAREDAEEAQQVRQRLEESVVKLASTLGLDPGLTVHQKLDLIGEQLRGMRGRTNELEDQLTGLRKYGEVAKLNIWASPAYTGTISTTRATYLAR